MEEWLRTWIPSGPWQGTLVAAAAVAGKLSLAVVVFLVARSFGARALRATLLPLERRAGRDGESGAGRVRTLGALAQSALFYSLLGITVVTVLGQMGVNVLAMLAGAGVAGLALSFGAQRLVRDVLTGFFLLLEDQFRVGETVTLVGGPGLPQFHGEVLEVGLRVTRLRDTSGRFVTLSNGDVVAVINHARGPVSVSVDVGVAGEIALDTIQSAVAQCAPTEEYFSGPAVLEGLVSVEAEKQTVRIRASARPGRAPEAEMALRQAVVAALRAAGIEVR